MDWLKHALSYDATPPKKPTRTVTVKVEVPAEEPVATPGKSGPSKPRKTIEESLREDFGVDPATLDPKMREFYRRQQARKDLANGWDREWFDSLSEEEKG